MRSGYWTVSFDVSADIDFLSHTPIIRCTFVPSAQRTLVSAARTLIGSARKFPSALIVPVWEQVESYCRLKGIPELSHAELCQNPKIIDLFERQIESLTPDLARYEKIKKFALLEDEFTIEGGELTPTMKVKRRVIDEKYKSVIDRIYDEAG